MISHSTSGLTVLPPERDVTVVEEEHHQAVLARYAPPEGAMPRRVVVELHHAPVARGTYAGRPGVEILLDGHRVGELTFRMAQRYGPVLAQTVQRGERPGARATVKHGRRGLVEVELRLPALGTPAEPEQRRGAPPAPPAPPADRRTRRKLLIGAGAVGAALVLFGIIGGNSHTTSTPSAPVVTDVTASTATAAPEAAVLTPDAAVPTPPSAVPTPPASTPAPVAGAPTENAPSTITPKTITPRTITTTAPARLAPPVEVVPEPAARPDPEPVDEPEPAKAAASYKNCTEARNAGVTPLYIGQPGYAPKLDRDKDGIACE